MSMFKKFCFAKYAGHFEFFAKIAKHKNAYISKTSAGSAFSFPHNSVLGGFFSNLAGVCSSLVEFLPPPRRLCFRLGPPVCVFVCEQDNSKTCG